MRRVLLGAVAVLAATGSVACSGDHVDSAPASRTASTSPRPSPTAAPAPPPAPARADCYSLTYAQALAPTSDQTAVGCDTKHTSQTFLVGRLRTAIGGHLVAVDSDTVQHEVADTCPARLAAYLGGTQDELRLSLLRSVWFTPSVEQSDAGASWYRCDVVAAYGNEQLADIDGDLKDALAKPQLRADYAMCATDRPGAADFKRVLCRDPHSWRAIRTVDLTALGGKDAHFPGDSAVEQGDEVDGDHVCADAARAIATDSLDYQWGYEWPTRDQWRTGQHYGRCWAPDPGTAGG